MTDHGAVTREGEDTLSDFELLPDPSEDQLDFGSAVVVPLTDSLYDRIQEDQASQKSATIGELWKQYDALEDRLREEELRRTTQDDEIETLRSEKCRVESDRVELMAQLKQVRLKIDELTLRKETLETEHAATSRRNESLQTETEHLKKEVRILASEKASLGNSFEVVCDRLTSLEQNLGHVRKTNEELLRSNEERDGRISRLSCECRAWRRYAAMSNMDARVIEQKLWLQRLERNAEMRSFFEFRDLQHAHELRKLEEFRRMDVEVRRQKEELARSVREAGTRSLRRFLENRHSQEDRERQEFAEFDEMVRRQKETLWLKECGLRLESLLRFRENAMAQRAREWELLNAAEVSRRIFVEQILTGKIRCLGERRKEHREIEAEALIAMKIAEKHELAEAALLAEKHMLAEAAVLAAELAAEKKLTEAALIVGKHKLAEAALAEKYKLAETAAIAENIRRYGADLIKCQQKLRSFARAIESLERGEYKKIVGPIEESETFLRSPSSSWKRFVAFYNGICAHVIQRSGTTDLDASLLDLEKSRATSSGAPFKPRQDVG